MFDEPLFDKEERAETRPPTDLVCLTLDDSEFNRHWSQDESFKFDKIYKNLQMQVAKSSRLSQ